jgi:hypothetical protein
MIETLPKRPKEHFVTELTEEDSIRRLHLECPAFSEPDSMRETLSQGAGYVEKEEAHP